MASSSTYQTPFRSVSYKALSLRPAAAVFGKNWQELLSAPRRVPTAPAPVAVRAVAAMVNPASELRSALAGLKDAVRVYDFARVQIGEANRTASKPVMVNGTAAIPAKLYTREQRRARRSLAFREFNRRRAQLLAARRRLDDAQLALGLSVDGLS